MISISENKDNLEFMASFPEDFFEIGIPDPEYGIGEAGKNHKSRERLVKKDSSRIRRAASNDYTRKDWDNQRPTREYFIELFRVTQNQIVFGANYFEELIAVPQKPPRRNDFDLFLKNNPVGWIIWDKVNGGNDFSDCELIWTSFGFDSFVMEYMWQGMNQGKSITEGNIMQGNKKFNEVRIHPTQKPVIIYRYLMTKFCLPGCKILDTHSGSQSSRIAADIEGFDYWGCEKDKEYFDKGNNRFLIHKQTQRLFK